MKHTPHRLWPIGRADARSAPASSGYTLIELLLYVAIIGALLGSVTMFFSASVESRVKNQSISEVEQQGKYIIEILTQTIRNADDVTVPAAGATGSSLSLTVPTGSLSPTVFNTGSVALGYNADGTATDTSNSNNMNATKFVASASGTISTLYARVGATIGTAPNNVAQMAIYSGNANPSTLLASSSSVTLTANSWIAFPISSVSVTSGTTYWLAYNTNGTGSTQNNLRYHAGASGQSMFTAQAFGSWNPSWSGSSQAREYSVYADIVISGGTTFQIKEGANAAVPLHNSKVEMSGLTFSNLTRPSTPGIVQITFTLGRVNASNRNEYDYEKTFTSSAALRWP